MSVFPLPLHLVSASNARDRHWRERHRRSKVQRECAHYVACAYGVMPLRFDQAVTVRIVRVAPRELDDDNLRGATKSVRDGLADALGLKSDRDPRVTWEYGQQKGASRVLVEITLLPVRIAVIPKALARAARRPLLR